MLLKWSYNTFMNRNYICAIAVLSGTIIGAGLFAVPLVVSKAGLVPFLLFLPFLAVVQFFLHTIYAEIILSSDQRHRLAGYVGVYCGSRAKNWALLFSIIGKHGAILAYIILGGSFLYALLNPVFGGSLFFYTVILYLIQSVIVFFGLRLIAGVELALSTALVILVLLIAFKSYPYFDLGNFALVNKDSIFLPYGPIFFAVGGQVAIPEICRMLRAEKEKIRGVIAWGTFIPAVFVFIFVLVVVGVTGNNTTSDALVGLQGYFDNGIIIFALIFGLLTVITSFLINSQSLREVYWWDIRINNNLSWLLACGTPFLLYLLGVSDLTKVIGLTGSVIGGVFGVILILLLLKVKNVRSKSPVINNKLRLPLVAVLCLVFFFGLFYELWHFFY